MTKAFAHHLDDATLASLAAGTGVAEDSAHLASCALCSERLARLEAQRGVGSDDLETETGAPALEEARAIGRYRLLGTVGRGATGEVFAAYDPDLDRNVAIKLLHHRTRDAEASARMLREAQALAKISHPGVVAVHDVGAHDGGVFLAMELSDGGSLRSWLRDTPRSSAEVLPVLAQAARGLAAAHDAGLIHRDVKPDNILIDTKGRARVGDFGLASLGSAEPATAKRARLASSPVFQSALTATGAIVGTPAYMAPELLHGQPATERSDQFAFCVTAYEALYGARPFPATVFADLVEQICSGRLAEPPRGRGVPSRVHRAVARGLKVAPGDRHASMRTLAEIFEDPRGRKRVALGASLVAGAVIAGGLAVAWPRHEAPAPCAGAEAELVGAWDAQRRDGAAQAFARAGTELGADQLRRITPMLDGYRARWISAATRACQDTHVRRVHDVKVLELRQACLIKRRRHLVALSDQLASADARTVTSAIDLVDNLPALDDCDDVPALRAVTAAGGPAPLPSAELDKLEDELVALDLALELAHEAKSLAPRIAAALAKARSLGARRPEAHALALRGQLAYAVGELVEAEPVLREAILAADEARDDDVRATAWGYLVMTARDLRNDPAEIETLSKQARAAYRRTSTEQQTEEWWDTLRAGSLMANGEMAQAAAVFRTFLERGAKSGTSEHNLAIAMEGLVLTTEESSPPAQTLATLQRALAIRVRRYGELHPDTADLRVLEATALSLRGEHAAGAAHLERATQLFERCYGADSDSVASALVRLGVVYRKLGRLNDAAVALERALTIRERVYGAEHPAAADAMQHLAAARARLGETDSALAMQREALRIIVATQGPTAAAAAQSHAEIGRILLARRKTRDAHDELARAVQLTEAAFGPRSVWLPEMLVSLGEAQAALRRREAARRTFERAHVMIEELGLDPTLRAGAEVAMARGARD